RSYCVSGGMSRSLRRRERRINDVIAGTRKIARGCSGYEDTTEMCPNGRWILFEPELHFGADVLVPDLADWRRERLPSIPDAAAVTLAAGLGLRGPCTDHGHARPHAQDADLCP